MLLYSDLVSVYFWPPVTTILSFTSIGSDVLDSTKENLLWYSSDRHRGRHGKKIPHILLSFISSFLNRNLVIQEKEEFLNLMTF